MKNNIEIPLQRTAAALLAAVMAFSLAACSSKTNTIENLVENDAPDKKIVNLFGPMEKSDKNLLLCKHTAAF